MTIFISDLTIRSVDNQFRMLVSRNLTACVDSGALCWVDATYTTSAFTAYCPLIVVCHYVVILFLSHYYTYKIYMKETPQRLQMVN